jgi:ataxia telangiectasia mutated family protein
MLYSSSSSDKTIGTYIVQARELEVMMKRLDVQKGNQRDYSMKIFEIRKQLELDNEEAQRMEVDKEQFLGIALESYCSCLLTGNKYNLRVVQYLQLPLS